MIKKIRITILAVIIPCLLSSLAHAAGGGVQPELELQYPEGYLPVNTSAAAATLTFPADFSGKDLTAMLHENHPRLYATSEDWQRIRKQIPNNPYLTAANDMIIRVADTLLGESPLKRILIGRRMLYVSREALKRVLTLASAYRVTDDHRYFERARAELLNVAAFTDWNPSHFLDTAEMTMAVAIGYDWLWHDLSPTDRATLKTAILEKGLEPGSGPAVANTITYWKLKDNNWVQSCYGGMVAGALAIAEDKPDLAATFLRDAFTHLHQALDAYVPDGAFPEGPGYWEFGTHYSVMLDSILHSSLRTTWNLDQYPGFQASALYMNLMIGPSNKTFNYSDGSSDVGLNPALHWFATQARNSSIDAGERQQLLANPNAFTGESWAGRFFPLTLVWLDPTLPETSEEKTMPLNWSGDGLNPVSVHRSSWSPDALFFGLKAGSPSNNHGHMDIGSFVLDWQGVRWATDLGSQVYNTLEKLGMNIWGYKDQQSQRWDVFRLNNFSHNTLVFDDQKQLIDGFASILAFSDDPKSPFTVIDMTPVYRNSVQRALRGMRLIKNDTVLIHDELTGFEAGHSVRWGMLTEADVTLHGSEAELHLDGKTLHARILSPANAQFKIAVTNPPPHSYDEANPGTRMLAVYVGGDGQPCDLRVVLSGDNITDAIAKKLSEIPAPSEWKPRKY